MYEHFDSLYSWAIQHNAQEILGILAFCLAVLVPIAAIVLAAIDTVLDYALRYINEDNKRRTVLTGWGVKERSVFYWDIERGQFSGVILDVNLRKGVKEVPFITWTYTLYFSSIFLISFISLYFLPFWLIVTGATVYGTLRTARFATRVSKKFNKHLEKEHSNETQRK